MILCGAIHHQTLPQTTLATKWKQKRQSWTLNKNRGREITASRLSTASLLKVWVLHCEVDERHTKPKTTIARKAETERWPCTSPEMSNVAHFGRDELAKVGKDNIHPAVEKWAHSLTFD